MAEETLIGGVARDFPATRWTRILSSRAGTEARRTALSELLQAYWKPLYFHARRKGLNIEAAKDAVQGFFVNLLERDFMDRLDPERGRFRSYLRTAMDHYLVNLHENASARKRGGDRNIVSLDIDVAERDFKAGPAEDAFDREWAAGVMKRVLARLRQEFEAGARKGSFDVALRYFQPGDPPPYAEAAAACGMGSVQFKAFLHRTRARFRELLREEVAHTVADARESDAEIEHLLKALSA